MATTATPLAMPTTVPTLPTDRPDPQGVGSIAPYPLDAPPTEGQPTSPETVQTSWYMRADYFHWNERMDGSDLVNEDGVLWTLGYLRHFGNERFRAELFGSDVHYSGEAEFDDGTTEPLSSHTEYLGLRAEYELLFAPTWWPQTNFFTGLGTQLWLRNLPDSVTAEGDPVSGYEETWWTLYPYVGMQRSRPLQDDLELYSSGRIGVTAITHEEATVNNVVLWPKMGVIGQWECGLRGKCFFVGTSIDLMTWHESAVVRGWLQPSSSMFTAGIKTGLTF